MKTQLIMLCCFMRIKQIIESDKTAVNFNWLLTVNGTEARSICEISQERCSEPELTFQADEEVKQITSQKDKARLKTAQFSKETCCCRRLWNVHMKLLSSVPRKPIHIWRRKPEQVSFFLLFLLLQNCSTVCSNKRNFINCAFICLS